MKTDLISRIAHRAGAAPDGVTRRKFLQTTLAAGAGLMLGGRGFAAGSSAPRVVIIGAGFGGLSCGFQLQQAGARVTLLEARRRLGGRVLSIDNFISGKVVEGGAELIGTNHSTWMAYGERFGLNFRDVTPFQDEQAPIIINGKRYIGAEVADLWDRLFEALQLLNADARKVNLDRPWDSPDAQRFDHMSLADAAAAWEVDDVARRAALAVMENDNATPPSQASYLGTLSVIAGGGYEEFWTESEVLRCEGGNQQLAFKLAEAIGADHIRMGNPVAGIQLAGEGVVVRLADGERLEADLAVLTVPPSAWEHFEIDPALPEQYHVAVGPAIKYLSKVSRPFWKDQGLQPNSLSDTAVGHTWEGTDGLLDSDEEAACLTVFSGGNPAQQCLDFAADQRKERFAEYLEALYPGYREHVQKGMFMGWPEEKWTQCGYSQARLGQATTVWPNLWKGFEDRLFFAGEYASWKFTGFMEGGLHSGAVLARNLATKLNLPAG